MESRARKVVCVLAAVIEADPVSVNSVARYEIVFETTLDVPQGGTLTVTFPIQVVLPRSMSVSNVFLTDSGGSLPFDPDNGFDPVVNHDDNSVQVTVPQGQTLGAGGCSLVFAISAGIVNPSIGSKDYELEVRTSEEAMGTGEHALLVIKPTYSLSAKSASRWTPVTVNGEGWTPDTSISIGGALSGTGAVARSAFGRRRPK